DQHDGVSEIGQAHAVIEAWPVAGLLREGGMHEFGRGPLPQAVPGAQVPVAFTPSILLVHEPHPGNLFSPSPARPPSPAVPVAGPRFAVAARLRYRVELQAGREVTEGFVAQAAPQRLQPQDVAGLHVAQADVRAALQDQLSLLALARRLPHDAVLVTLKQIEDRSDLLFENRALGVVDTDA